jgi:hypothetical protein
LKVVGRRAQAPATPPVNNLLNLPTSPVDGGGGVWYTRVVDSNAK